ncbi:HEXXH motif-containing putative peptide modification protein [Streptomyces sp. NPDC052015]|uniref:aKG-HExxH-type peptide beta-hydroxylase n=1 Tax=Streptomyces sp. NPDC052015 TaxID=3154755 RepID=UPI0034136322
MGSIADDGALLVAERALAEDVPFGSYAYISTRVLDQYVELLSTIAESSPGARALLDSTATADGELQRSVLGDPLVRRTIEDGIGLYQLGHDAIDEQSLDAVLAAADKHARDSHSPLLAETAGCVSISSASHHGYVWTATEDNMATRRFTTQCLGRIPVLRIEQPTDETLGCIVEGAKNLDILLPELGRSASAHTFMVVVANAVGDLEYESLTVPGLPGVIFLSPTVLTSPVRAAEVIFHESMHLKLMDIDYAEHLFAPGFRPLLSPMVSPPWQGDDKKQPWPLDRILTAMHVYTGLAVFFGRFELMGSRSGVTGHSEYPVDPLMKYQSATERARYLLDISQDHLDVFSAAGHSFIKWIAEIHKILDVHGADKP